MFDLTELFATPTPFDVAMKRVIEDVAARDRAATALFADVASRSWAAQAEKVNRVFRGRPI